MRHRLPRRSPVLPIVIGIVLAIVAGVGALRAVWVSSSAPAADAGAPRDARVAERADRGEHAGRGDARCDGKPLSAPRELRGIWITTVENIDWPSTPGLPDEQIKAEYRGWLDLAQQRNLNAVFVHVRPSGDALWPSKYAPWSEWITGVRGKAPGFDLMQWMIDETHARNLEFHAWFNPYRGSQPGPNGAGPDIEALAPDHPLRKHPEWAVVYPAKGTTGSRLHFNPGIPEARKFVEDSMLEAVERYDVDGVHFDDFFYQYPVGKQDYPDQAAYQQYGGGKSKADWRRDNVNKLVEEMSVRIRQLKPWVKFGISPFGIWRNATTDPQGSPTRGLQSYDEIYADTRLWVQRQWLDYIVPQLYWNIGFDVADYAKLLPWWVNVVKDTRVQLYIGQADYRVGQSGVWSDPAELDRQLALNRTYPQVTGSVHFSAKSMRSDALGSVSRYAARFYGTPALPPVMDWLPEHVPAGPTVRASRDGDQVKLSWKSKGTSVAVYRVDGDKAGLVATRRGGDGEWTGPAGTYCVTALDRSWNESEPIAA
ncbi:glycoside hydrolase family 10 protein [Dactylosporangium sucinum]|uniref:Glycosyl hydrolase n=1 Tax=Dactylosporangium sucinum TaxID=1424081 RepID=A0A917T8X3_9ACTN|nr:family 10 glycosylhydrolase [Dactylosporangium sucinum]GGM14816.1 glycosyl hydrolase [Dactylosporangium sucinum]